MIFRPHRFLILSLFLILLLGLMCLYSSCHQKGDFVRREIFQKQLLWVGVGLCAMFLIARVDYRKVLLVAWPLYGFGILSLCFVLFFSRAIMGAQRWISLGELSFQPSELTKFALILVLAKYYGRKKLLEISPRAGASLVRNWLFWPLGLTLFPMLLVMAQPDLGTALVYLFIFFSIAFLGGVRLRYLFGLLACGIVSFPFFWHFLKDYQKSRLLVFLNPNMDPLGAGYTVIQSKIAIGSGQFFGKGWLAGTQSQLNFLAERHTDFIFSVMGEEWGFLGGFVLIFLYVVLILMILRSAEVSRDATGRLFSFGVAAVLFFHSFINIAMNAGFCPVVGLPLPFFSYGGSSLVINLVALGIVLGASRQK